MVQGRIFNFYQFFDMEKKTSTLHVAVITMNEELAKAVISSLSECDRIVFFRVSSKFSGFPKFAEANKCTFALVDSVLFYPETTATLCYDLQSAGVTCIGIDPMRSEQSGCEFQFTGFEVLPPSAIRRLFPQFSQW